MTEIANQTQTHMHVEEVLNDDASELVEEEEEEQLMEMNQKVVHHRNTVAEELKNTLTSLVAAQRPFLPTPFNHHHPDVLNPMESASMDPEDAKKLLLLKQTISSNACAIPLVLKRMEECMARIDNLRSYNGVIHPVFLRERSS